jgi:phage baseplate assembly protein W
MSAYTSYIIAQGDTLESISLSQLGSDQVASIIALNNLRYPYISDDPIDQLAQKKGTLQLLGVLNAGSSSFSLGNQNSLIVNALDSIFFSDPISGRFEAVVIKNVVPSSSSVQITSESPLTNSYGISAEATLFVNQENIITSVLQTGAILYLPTVPSAVFSVSQNTSDIYGTDWYVDDNGFFEREGNQIKLSTGLDNLQQAMTMALRTPRGSMEGEQNYGNKVFGIIGEVSEPYFWNLAEAYSSQCVLQDPRVSAVAESSIVVTEDSSSVVIKAVPATAQNVVTAQAPLPTGGG